jgi:polyhydroxyalkanoate synthase
MTRISDYLVSKISPSRLDPFGLGRLTWDFWSRMLRNPGELLAQNVQLAADQARLLQYAVKKATVRQADAIIEPEAGDKRFRDASWNENLVFDLIKQSYLLASRYYLNLAGAARLDPRQQHKLEFLTRQFVDALSPTNFAVTNPEVLRATIDTRGANLLQGVKNLGRDLAAGKGRLKISMVDESRFEIGKNIATTPGSVVFENDLMQLIQYRPSTDKVYQRPLVIFPAWINKYYILDLSPKNSFIRWAVGQGYTVFVVSWVNPDESLARKTFEDYLNEGVFAALDAVEAATGEKRCNAIGYCIGGTLLASALAQMGATGDDRIAAATFLTSQVDFTEAGDLMVFIDEAQLDSLEGTMKKRGYLDASEMATTFNMLRANDLIWSFVVNNYLLGRSPAAFDLLYWNNDSTRMPVAMHTFYLREMYLHNRLAQPGGIMLNGVPLDLANVKVPVFLQSSKDDHIAPYPSVFKATKLFSGPVTFMLAGSGHIAGVINPPAANKYYYYTRPEMVPDVDDWIEGAEYHEGSWWPYWHQWLRRRSGRKVPARVPGAGELPVIEDAPGRYVTMK